MAIIRRLDLEKDAVKVYLKLVKLSQTRSNLINGLETTELSEIHIQTLIIGIEKYGDILVLVKFEANWMVKLREHSPYKYTSHVHHAPYLDLKSNR